MYFRFEILSVGALTVLIIAFVAEYIFLIHPCHLCWYERYIYMALLAISLLGCIYKRIIFFIFSLIILVIGCIVAFYHFGIENHWWQSTCQYQLNEAKTVEELKKLMTQAPSVLCNKPLWKIFGLSAVFWNLIYQIFLFILMCLSLKKIKPGKITGLLPEIEKH